MPGQRPAERRVLPVADGSPVVATRHDAVGDAEADPMVVVSVRAMRRSVQLPQALREHCPHRRPPVRRSSISRLIAAAVVLARSEAALRSAWAGTKRCSGFAQR